MVVARGREGGAAGWLLFCDYRVSVLQNEKSFVGGWGRRLYNNMNVLNAAELHT